MPRLLCLLLAGLMGTANLSAAPTTTLLAASDPRFRYEGRFDRTEPERPVFIWAGSRIVLDFEGAALAVRFGQASGQTFFNVTVDDDTVIADGAAGRLEWPQPLGEGRHRLSIVKRSEAAAGEVVFLGIELAVGARAWAAPVPDHAWKFEFLGDSITVGANNEDGAEDQWEDRRTHNHVLSYGYLTSQAFAADHRAMAVSGMGICEGYVPMKAGETWDKVYPRADSPPADLAAWTPDVVFVNFGENDTSFTSKDHRPFPAGFAAGYVALIKDVRSVYPAARIVLLRGGMGGGANSPDLRAAWEAAVSALEAGDSKIGHFVFTHWTSHHPRVADHRIMADELTAWLRAQTWMTR